LGVELPALLALLALGLMWPAILEAATSISVWAGWYQLAPDVAAVEAIALLLCIVTLAVLRGRVPATRAGALWHALIEAVLWLLLGILMLAPLPVLTNRQWTAPDGESSVAIVLMALAMAVVLACGLNRLAASPSAVRASQGKRQARILAHEVAVLIPAHNEERTIAKCLRALSRSIDMRHVFVGSDASDDRTVEFAMSFGCHVDDIRPNRGKAGVLTYLLDRHSICERYRAVLLLDSDSELDQEYLLRALPLFDDPRVAAVAGHVVTDWKDHRRPSWAHMFVAYRWRLYRIFQAVLRYGQTWGPLNVAYIVPGFASMYRTSILAKLDISAPGLVIEDFNMTFELHRKRLGRIAYSPLVRCVSQDPTSLRDYIRQVSRWNLGFWQTVRRNGVWLSAFWLSLGVFIVEVLVASLFFFFLPIQIFLHFVAGTSLMGVSPGELAFVDVDLIDLVVTLLAVDYAMTVVVAAIDRKPMLLIYGVAFPLLRWIDAMLILKALAVMWFVKSDGRWRSPARA
jgi:cellulose synthase/poly-beta-1,6-N-acetylglucosamine synthase-like glycosyltransferase